jgi:HD superfamily phosphohydrolase YqeK
MEQRQLEKLKVWFDDYVAGFYGDDEYTNANIKLKEEHTRRVCEETLYLADELGLKRNQKRIAEVIAIFHDIGRFEQFIKYQTYHDPKSVNHCQLALEVLNDTKVLDGIENKEIELIEKAIEYHGAKELPGDLDGECLLLSKLIRDADKLDIFYVMIENYRQYRADPDEFEFEVELPDNLSYSAEVLEGILRGRQIDYNELRTWNDMRLMQLGWVYDVNFAATLKRIRQRKFLEKIFDFLPETEDIDKVRKKVFEYVDSAIKEG